MDYKLKLVDGQIKLEPIIPKKEMKINLNCELLKDKPIKKKEKKK